jgi:hypothetical protein
MSKHETPMIMRYWERVGGTLIEEFPVVKAGRTNGPRRIDAVILPREEKRIASWRDVDLTDKDVLLVQAKAKRLGMSLMGQTLISARLIEAFRPASVRSVALCTADDSVLRPLLEEHEGMTSEATSARACRPMALPRTASRRR